MTCFSVSASSDRRLKFHFWQSSFSSKSWCVSMERLWVLSEDVVFAGVLNRLIYGPLFVRGKSQIKIHNWTDYENPKP